MKTTLPTGRNGRLLAVGLVLATLGVLWLGVAQPLLGWYGERAAMLSRQDSFAARLDARAAELPALERAQAVRRHAPPRSGAPDRLLAGSTDAIAAASLQQIVQGLAHADGAVISSAETLAPGVVGSYRRIRLRVTASGDWPVLVRLFGAITADHAAGMPTVMPTMMPPMMPTMMIDDLRLQAGEFAPKAATPPLTALFTVIAFRAETAHPSAHKRGSPGVVK